MDINICLVHVSNQRTLLKEYNTVVELNIYTYMCSNVEHYNTEDNNDMFMSYYM